MNSFLVDSWARLNTNDSVLNYYHFWWTNPWYIIPFFIILTINWIDFFNLPTSVLFKLFLSLFFFVYFLETQFFFLSNNTLFLFNLNLSNFNTFLFNNFNKYHPFILYLSASFFLLICFSHSVFMKNRIFFAHNIEDRFTTNSIKVVLFSLSSLSLFLGSWWAAQESSWGGWWNWDSSETLGLLILIFVSIISHFYFIKISFFNYYFFSIISFIFVLLSYFFIQLNFDLSSHNFGIKFFFFFNNNFFFIENIYFLALAFLFVFKVQKSHKIFLSTVVFKIVNFKTLLFEYFTVQSFFLSTIFLSVSLSVIFSYFDIVNFFFWTTFGFNFFNSQPQFDYLTYFFVSNFLAFFFTLNNFLPFFFLFPFAHSLNFICIIPFFSISYFSHIHFFLFVFLLSVIYSYDTESLTFALFSSHLDFLDFDFLTSYLSNNFIINFFFVECSHFFHSEFFLSFSWFVDNIFCPFNNTFFHLVSSNNFFFNHIRLGVNSSSVMFLNDIQSLSNLFLFFFSITSVFNFFTWHVIKKINTI